MDDYELNKAQPLWGSCALILGRMYRREGSPGDAVVMLSKDPCRHLIGADDEFLHPLLI